jgi:hypothetical protein
VKSSPACFGGKGEAEGRFSRAQSPKPVARPAHGRNYVDRMRGRLIGVSWQDQSDKIQSITIQYEPYQVQRRVNGDAQTTTIEEICIHVYKQRKKIAATQDKSPPRRFVSVANGA